MVRVRASFSDLSLMRAELFSFEEECDAHGNERDGLADHWRADSA